MTDSTDIDPRDYPRHVTIEWLIASRKMVEAIWPRMNNPPQESKLRDQVTAILGDER